jgi:ATP-dependent DNA helicase DinG
MSTLPRHSAEPAPTAVLVLGRNEAVWLSEDGEFEHLSLPRAARRLESHGGALPIVVHHAAVARRLGLSRLDAADALELFAFVHPARPCVPTPRGLAEATGQERPDNLEDQALAVMEAVARLSFQASRLRDTPTIDLLHAMTAAGWHWGAGILAAMGVEPAHPRGLSGLDIWSRLPEWSEAGPIDPPGSHAVDPADARRRLAALLGRDAVAEPRPQQADYASAVSAAFAPRGLTLEPAFVLAEAGTGVGKTLGYLAPASVWAERNGGAVWISTYTRNLQSQIEQELDRLYPDPAVKAERVVVRKGRENYLCLLNLEDSARAVMPRVAQGGYNHHLIALGLMARWALASRDGALVGGDLPGWLVDLLGRGATLGLADRRGECIYSACPHYQRCFIEHSVRKARRADIVIANHALVMVQAALGGLDDAYLPTRYVFDEGHHVTDAADSAFSAHLSGQASFDLRRWLLGVDAKSGRARGLRRRVEDLIADNETALGALQAALVAAAALPGEGWLHRLTEDEPHLAIERFLAFVRKQVLARAAGVDGGFDLEVERQPPVDGLLESATEADRALAALEVPLTRLVKHLETKLDDDAAELDSATRQRIEALTRGIDRRLRTQVKTWRGMLADLNRPTPDGMVDWLSIAREFGRESDIGLHRHWIDPTIPFIEAVVRPAHGVVVTSATLTDGTGDNAIDWHAAEARSGAVHLAQPATRAAVPSPFDYASQTLALVVTDVRKDDMDQVAAAYRELFLAAGGGGLGLFTAVSRLRAVHERIAGALEQAGLPLLAQHLDGMDVGTLIDIFRAEEDSCLLGTDAVRDGVDVPGRSLRLIVFDRVPWPRPDIMHKARKAAFGAKRYDDMLTRFKLRQAFGRLVRRADDSGVFVLLDSMMPSRLLGAFPEGVAVERIGLAEAIARTGAFLQR